MKLYTSSPSNYGKKNEWRNLQLAFRKVPICDHREGRVGDDVTLYYPGFQRFIDNCHKIELSTEDFAFAKKVCDKMSKYFSEEKGRENAFANVIMECFEIDDNDVDLSERFQSVPDIAINPDSCVMIEVKNESGQGGGSDSHSQAIGYYVQSLEKRKQDKCPAPAYLIELVGPQLTISGAVYGRYVFVDKLIDPVELVPQHNEKAIIKIARIFRALKEAYGKIRQYYKNVPETQPRSPIFKSFYKGKIQYREAIKRHTFEGILTYNNGERKDVVVMFVKQYSRETHKLMDSCGYAPKLIHYEERAGGTQYTAIVMEHDSDARPLDEFLKFEAANENFDKIKKSAREHCTKALTVMHKNGFCHGKISSKSILSKVQGEAPQIFIVNYEWAGRQGVATYPLSADILDKGVQPGYLITQDQDKDQLKKLFQELNIT